MSKTSIEFVKGDLYWAKIGSYPYWPCIVTTSPGSQSFQKPAKKGAMVHVHFYGDNGKHCWVSSSALMPFKGVEEFNKNKFKTGDTTKILPGFNVKPNLKPSWDHATKEIEAVLNLDNDKRIAEYYILYPLKYTNDKKTSVSNNKRKSLSSEEESDLPASPIPNATKVIKTAPPKKAIKSEVLQNGPSEEKVEPVVPSTPVVEEVEVKTDTPLVTVKSKKAEAIKKESKKKITATPTPVIVEPKSEPKPEPEINIEPALKEIEKSIQSVVSNKKQFNLAKNYVQQIVSLATNNNLSGSIELKI